MKKLRKNRIISLLLAIVMVVGILPLSSLSVFAEGEGTYTITFDANGGSGTMEPVEVANGTKYTVRREKIFCGFTPPEGKNFDGWARYPDGTGKFKESEKTSGSQTLYAVWESPRKITIVPSEHGSITTDSAEAFPNTNVKFEAHPEPGYKLKEWKVISGDVYTGGGDFWGEFLMQYTDVTVTAVFEKAYTLTVTTNGSFDSFEMTGMIEDYVVGTPIPMIPGEYFSANVPFTYSGDSYGFVKWEVVSGDMVLEDAYDINTRFEMPESDVVLNAVYDRNFTTYVSPGEGHGTVSLHGHSSLTVTTGVTYDVVAVPDDGYYLAGFKVRSAGGGYERSNYPFKRRSNNGYSFVAGTDAQYIIADFKPIGGEGWVGPTSCEVTLVSGEGYTVEKYYADADTTVEYDRSFYVKVIIHEGYAKSKDFAVLANGVEIAKETDFYGFDEYPIYGIREDTEVTVRGVGKAYTISIFANNGSGEKETYTVAAGDTFTLPEPDIFTQSESLLFKYWMDPIGRRVADSFVVNENKSINAKWDKVYKLTLQQPEHGKIVASADRGIQNDQIRLTTLPDEGYRLKSWKIVSGSAAGMSTHNEFIEPYAVVTMGTSDVVVTAEFERAYTISITSNHAGVTFTSGGSFVTERPAYVGEHIRVLFNHKSSSVDDTFLKWAVNGVDIDEQALYGDRMDYYSISFVMPANDVDLSAIFGKPIVISVSAEHGRTGQQSFYCPPGKKVNLEVTPDNGYYLAEWKYLGGGAATLKRAGSLYWEFTAPNDDVDLLAICEPVPGGPYTVTFSSGEGYDLSHDILTVPYNGCVEFDFELRKGYVKTEDFAVLLDGVALTPYYVNEYKDVISDHSEFRSYKYLSGIRHDMTVTVRGVEKICNITLPRGEFTITPENGSVSPMIGGGSYSFSLILNEDYIEGPDFAVKANGVVINEVDGIYTVSDIHDDVEITVEGVAEKYPPAYNYRYSNNRRQSGGSCPNSAQKRNTVQC